MDREISVEHLVDRARRGDQAAWEQLLASLYPRLRAFAGRRMPAQFVEDAVSETMTRAVAGIDGFRLGPSGFDGWVFGIGRNVIADHYRKTTRQHRWEAGAHPADANTDEQPGESLELGEDHAQLRRCFSLLSNADRELLELRVVAGLSADQTATVLHKRPGAVRTAQSRALARLRELLEQDDG